MSKTTQQIYKFGPFLLDTKEHLLLRDSQSIPLTLKSFKTLLVLVENSGHVVERSELVERVWPNTFVEEANLTQQVFTLRRCLGNDQNGGQYIETVPKLGYRFNATVCRVSREAPNLAVIDQAQARITTKNTMAAPDWMIDSIAVLPLTNVSNEPGTQHLCDGIAESIIDNLSQLSQLRVIALSTVFRYKGREADPQKIGHELNVRAVVTGRMTKRGDNLIFRVELVDVTDGSRLWGTEYTCRPSDILELHRRISLAISKELQIKLTGEKCGPTRRALYNSGSHSRVDIASRRKC